MCRRVLLGYINTISYCKKFLDAVYPPFHTDMNQKTFCMSDKPTILHNFTTYTRMQKCNHISSCLLNKLPGLSEVWACHGWADFFKSWGPFLQNMSLTLCQFSKKKSHLKRPMECPKLYLVFLCNTGIT